MTFIKICGIRRPEDAIWAAQCGANLIGLIFHPDSHRFVTEEEAVTVRSALDRLDSPPLLTGVFVEQDWAEIARIAAVSGLDAIQLSGMNLGPPPASLGLPVIRALRATCREDFPAAGDRIQQPQRLSTLPQPLFLLDTPERGAFGGTGKRGDWFLAAELASLTTMLLAGGLDAANVGEAISRVRPWGVDVSSGVETHKQKDRTKIEAFTRSVQAADQVSAHRSDSGLAKATSGLRS